MLLTVKSPTLRGLPKLATSLSTLLRTIEAGEGVGDEMKEVFMEGARKLRDEAKRMAPVRTGLLRDSIFATKGVARKPSALVGVNFNRAHHAHLVEFGHGGPHPAPPHPYMRPALMSQRPVIQKIITDGLSKILKRYA